MSEEVGPDQRTRDFGKYDIPLVSAAAELERHLTLAKRWDSGAVGGFETFGSVLRMQALCGCGRPQRDLGACVE